MTPKCSTPEPNPSTDAASGGLINNLDEHGIWSYAWDHPPDEKDLTKSVPTPPGFDTKLRLWKTPIWVAPGVNGTVSIISPNSAHLFVTTWDRWNDLSATQLKSGESSSVDVAGCDGIGTYAGLTMVPGASCVIFGIQLSGETNVTRVPVSFFGREC
jgi:hypothetical protein